jgi:hypothetical protein
VGQREDKGFLDAYALARSVHARLVGMRAWDGLICDTLLDHGCYMARENAGAMFGT